MRNRLLGSCLIVLACAAPAAAQTDVQRFPGKVEIASSAQDALKVTGGVEVGDGTVTAPARTYVSDPDLGAYRIGANNEGFTAGGTLRWDYDTARLKLAIDLQLAASAYLNFGATVGVNGYGVRDSGGVIQIKNSGGSWAAPVSLTNTLGDFAATTSAQLAAVVSDETGANKLVFSDNPTLVAPSLGAATATSVNKVAITAPASSATLTISDGKTLAASNTLTLTGTDASSIAFGGGGTVAYRADNLSVFASTTSAQLATLLSDETGSGANVFATSPTLVTPVLGVATATSINKVAFTTPASSATLTIADGKTLTSSNTLTFTGTDSSSVAFGAGGTVAYRADNLGVFGSTTSAQLATVLSDESGTGVAAYTDSPAFTTQITVGNMTVTSSAITTAASNSFIAGTTTGRNLFLRTNNTTRLCIDNGTAVVAVGGGFSGSTSCAASSPTDGTITGVDASGSNVAGGGFIIADGRGTGTGSGGPIKLQTAPKGSTGSSLNALETRDHIEASGKDLTESSATSVVRVDVASGSAAGVTIEWTVYATDGTDFQSRRGRTYLAIVNKAGTETCTVGDVGTPVVAVSTGTLTVATSCSTSPTNGVDFQLNAASSLTQTTLRAAYRVFRDEGSGTITPQ